MDFDIAKKLLDIAKHSPGGSLFLLLGLATFGITASNAANIISSTKDFQTVLWPTAGFFGIGCAISFTFFLLGHRHIRAARTATGHTPKYVLNYHAKHEAPICIPNTEAAISISRDRSYKILQHMFEHEDFKEFFAVDLAISWWYELDGVQGCNDEKTPAPLVFALPDSVTNESTNILRGISEQFNRDQGCVRFHRLFVITKEQFDRKETHRVFEIIDDQEREIRKRCSGRHIETRFLVWDACSIEQKSQIRSLRDMALWRGTGGNFALIDTQIDSPHDAENLKLHNIPDRRHTFCVHEEQLGRLSTAFTHAFSNAQPISGI